MFGWYGLVVAVLLRLFSRYAVLLLSLIDLAGAASWLATLILTAFPHFLVLLGKLVGVSVRWVRDLRGLHLAELPVVLRLPLFGDLLRASCIVGCLLSRPGHLLLVQVLQLFRRVTVVSLLDAILRRGFLGYVRRSGLELHLIRVGVLLHGVVLDSNILQLLSLILLPCLASLLTRDQHLLLLVIDFVRLFLANTPFVPGQIVVGAARVHSQVVVFCDIVLLAHFRADVLLVVLAAFGMPCIGALT